MIEKHERMVYPKVGMVRQGFWGKYWYESEALILHDASHLTSQEDLDRLRI